ncbi:MAG: LAGLIDADG family homing endonuclease [Dehalococcoidia bacterium]|jgi:hypothetical protein
MSPAGFPRAEALRGYTAGIIDGEGSIMINRSYGPTYKRGFSYRLEVTVTNTNEWLVNWLKMNYGGSIHLRKSRKPQEKDCYAWSLWSRAARRFLEFILPYLILKKAQAEIAIQFQGNKPPPGKSLSEEQMAVEDVARMTMQALNKKGVH